jgi:hypothetical protein
MAGGVQLIAGGEGRGYADSKTGSEARFDCAIGVLCSRDGQRLLIADAGNHCIRCVHIGSGAVTTLVGNQKPQHTDGKGAAASIHEPVYMAFDVRNESVVYITAERALRRLDLVTHELSTVQLSISGLDPTGIDSTPCGVLIFACNATDSLYAVDPDTGFTERLSISGSLTAAEAKKDAQQVLQLKVECEYGDALCCCVVCLWLHRAVSICRGLMLSRLCG